MIPGVLDPAPLGGELPKDRVNILLVIARPKEGDVKYRSVGRPLVELIEKRNLPAHVHVLRPPTFDRLREHLKERAGYYHIVHFDGHGGYGGLPAAAAGGSPHAYEAPEGRLLFEDEKGKPYLVSAEKLSTLLQEYRVPAMVLNACRSAMIDGRAADPLLRWRPRCSRRGPGASWRCPTRCTSAGRSSSCRRGLFDAR
jgi:hypothetical protein